MAFKAAYILDHARDILQDVDKDRYSDISLLSNLNVGIVEIRRMRPDYFIGRYYEEFTAAQYLDDYVNLPIFLFGPLVYFVAGMAEMRDDEYTTDGRAAAFIGMFRQAIGGQ